MVRIYHFLKKKPRLSKAMFHLVRETRIELAWVAPYAPQTYASTISAIPAAKDIIVIEGH